MRAFTAVVILAWLGLAIFAFAVLPALGAAGIMTVCAAVFYFQWRDMSA